jgi:hypothetical protein
MTSLVAKFIHPTPAPQFSAPRFVRSAGEFGAMASNAYRTGVAYRFSRESHGRRRVLNQFVADLQHRSA